MWFIPLAFLIPVSSVLLWLHRLKDRHGAPGRLTQVDGTRYKLMHTDRGHAKHWMAVGIDCETGFRFRVLREHALHRVLKRFGVAREWQGPDAGFNRACYVVSDDPEVERLLADPEVTRDFEALLTESPASADYRPRRIEVRPHHVALFCKKRSFRIRPKPRGIPSAAVPRLCRIATATQAHKPALPPAKRDPNRTRMYALVAPAMALLSIGTVRVLVDLYWASGPQLVSTAGLTHDLALAVPTLTAAWLLTACVMLKGSSRLPPALVEISLVGSLGLAIGGGVLAYLANIELDLSPREIVRTAVRDRTVDYRRRGPDRYYIHIHSYLIDDEPVEVRVPQSLYRHAHAERDILLTMREGALGYEWIEDVALSGEERSSTSDMRHSRLAWQRAIPMSGG